MLIAFKITRDRERNKTRKELRQKLNELEAKTKQKITEKNKGNIGSIPAVKSERIG